MHNANNVVTKGFPLDEADKVMIMIHGRGASAQSILSLSDHFKAEKMAYVAPQATGGSWYPYSFLAPMEQNEPGLSSALGVIGELVAQLQTEYGFNKKDIYLLGFSQGACLSLEFAARNADVFGGIFGLSGGLIGPDGTARDYQGSFGETPVFLGCSDTDFHIPKERVVESGEVFRKMGADVKVRLYPNFGHQVNEDEIDFVNKILSDG
ncbi:alpha/beta hydrolase [Dyadobacter helix]|nr:dienelactone hydrolase family protein [Dyadobacter sp. CECT 9275]